MVNLIESLEKNRRKLHESVWNLAKKNTIMSKNSLYKKFHHENPDHIEKIDMEFPTELIKLGVVTAIEYKASAPSKFTDGTYRHDFKKKPILSCDKNGVLYIIRAKITSRGIEDK